MVLAVAVAAVAAAVAATAVVVAQRSEAAEYGAVAPGVDVLAAANTSPDQVILLGMPRAHASAVIVLPRSFVPTRELVAVSGVLAKGTWTQTGEVVLMDVPAGRMAPGCSLETDADLVPHATAVLVTCSSGFFVLTSSPTGIDVQLRTGCAPASVSVSGSTLRLASTVAGARPRTFVWGRLQVVAGDERSTWTGLVPLRPDGRPIRVVSAAGETLQHDLQPVACAGSTPDA